MPAKVATTVVHLLKEQSNNEVTAKCGYTHKRQPAGPLGPFTGWGSKVTCPHCDPSRFAGEVG